MCQLSVSVLYNHAYPNLNVRLLESCEHIQLNFVFPLVPVLPTETILLVRYEDDKQFSNNTHN